MSDSYCTMKPNLALIETEPLKRCTGCKEWKAVSEFGVNSANINRGACDGLNVKCRICIRQSIAESRQRLREYKVAHPDIPANQITIQPGITSRQLARKLRRLKPHDKVLAAIRYGAQTQDEIRSATRLTKDDICEALAQLLLWSRDLRTDVVDGSPRRYFINELSTEVRRQPVKREAKSYGVSTVYFSQESA